VTVAILIVAALGAVGTLYLVRIEWTRRRDEVSASKRADVTARCVVTHPPQGSTVEQHYLEIENRGPAIARDVDLVTFASVQDGANVLDHLFMRDTVFPVPSLRPEETVAVEINLHVGSPYAPWRVELRWVDGTGDRAEEVVVTVRR
jgi:hypothetical protein